MAGLGWQPDATERIDIPHLHLPYVSQHGPLTTVVAPWSGCHYNVDNVGPDRHDVENALYHAILVDTGSFRFERQDDAVTQHVEQHRLDIFRADEVPPCQPGVCA